MNYLLNGEEVLSFGLDDYVHDKISQITIQSKSLCIYIVDYELGRVIKKIDKEFQVSMKSIFYDIKKQEENREFFQDLKEYVEQK